MIIPELFEAPVSFLQLEKTDISPHLIIRPDDFKTVKAHYDTTW